MKNKKAFTVVELVIVIAIIAILAAVLIPTFASLIKKANVSKDEQLIRNLNTALATSRAERNNKPHANMTEALEAAEKFGYEVDKINASATDNEILWDQKNDVFCYLNGEKVEYIPESVQQGDKLLKGDYQLWKIYNAKSGAVPAYANQTCSIYLGKDAVLTNALDNNVLKVKVGVDVGKRNDITSIEYSYTPSVTEQAHAAAIIRTNSANTELVVNAPQDTVKHYDSVGMVHVIAVDSTNCYEENGKAAFTQVDSGKYKTTESADVELLFVSNASAVTVEVVPGTVDHAHALDKIAAETLNGTTTGVTFDYDGNDLQASLTDVYHHVENGTQLGFSSNYANNKEKDIVVEAVETAIEKEAVEADESDFWIVCHADAFAGGTGTSGDPYIIKTARQLALLAYKVNTFQTGYASAYYKLDKDIDLCGKAWTPIGTTNGNDTLFFTGHFDGNGKSIIGLTNKGKSDADLGLYSDELSSVAGLAASYGLFGFTQNVNISDLTIKSASIDGSNYFKEAGIIIGMATGSTTMTNCTVDTNSSISGTSKIGGIIGFVNIGTANGGLGGNVTLTNCDFAGTVSVSADRAGAIIGAFCAHQSTEGYNLGHTHLLKDCDSTGTVNSGSYGTGLIGFFYQGTAVNTYGIKTVTFDNCTADTSKFTTTGHVAKYIGRLDSYTTAVIIKNDSYATNIIGDLHSGASLILKVENNIYGYKNNDGNDLLPSLTGNEETYKLGQMITNAPSGSWNEYWKTDRIGELVQKDTLFKIDPSSIDLSTGELKYGAGWYDTHISDFSSYVADGYHVIVPETYAVLETVDNKNNTIYHYIYQVVAD